MGCFIVLFGACETQQVTGEERKNLAKQLFHSVYGGHPEKIDALVSDDIVASYLIFSEIFGEDAIRGREAYKKFATGFSKRWKDPNITVHEAIAEEDKVVLLWSFSARRVNDNEQDSISSSLEYSWGGITLFRFNESNKIIAEIGEESTPGPFKRVELSESKN